jgi:glyoxylase-like metal-dependent hydrolase (beta-lactamase superfamily II)
MAARGPYYIEAFRPAMKSALDGTVLVPPTLTVSDSLTLDLGGREIVLNAWRSAHTDNDVTVLDKSTGTLFCGDLLFLQHVPVVDASLLGFLDVADRLRRIEAVRVVPGHGPVTAPWPQALDDETAYLMKLTADLRAAIKKGESVGTAAGEAGRSERGKWRLFDDYNARNATAGFAELEWETP